MDHYWVYATDRCFISCRRAWIWIGEWQSLSLRHTTLTSRYWCGWNKTFSLLHLFGLGQILPLLWTLEGFESYYLDGRKVMPILLGETSAFSGSRYTGCSHQLTTLLLHSKFPCSRERHRLPSILPGTSSTTLLGFLRGSYICNFLGHHYFRKVEITVFPPSFPLL